MLYDVLRRIYKIATLSDLTKRELEVAEMLSMGASKKEITTTLFISERTVESHTRTIYQKVGMSKVSKLSAWFIGTKYNVSAFILRFTAIKERIIVLVSFVVFLQFKQ